MICLLTESLGGLNKTNHVYENARDDIGLQRIATQFVSSSNETNPENPIRLVQAWHQPPPIDLLSTAIGQSKLERKKARPFEPMARLSSRGPFRDERTGATKDSLSILLAASDSYYGQWPAGGRLGNFHAVYACKPADAASIRAWLKRQSWAQRIRQTSPAGLRRLKRLHGDVHVYAVTPTFLKENIS